VKNTNDPMWRDSRLEKEHNGLSRDRSAGRQQRHSQLNDVIWRGLIKAKIHAATEPNGLTRIDGRRPDEGTLIPWFDLGCHHS